MKILLALPGRLKTVPMGQFSAQALRELGHTVELFDFWPNWRDKLYQKSLGRLSSEEHATINRRFRSAVEREKPDLVLAIYGFHLSRESLAYLKSRGIPSACWWLNDPFQFERSLQKAALFDHLFSNAWGSVADYRAHGVNAHWLPTACEPGIHKRVPAVPEYACDICFAGDWSPLREAWLTRLAQRYDVKVFGPWAKKIAPGSILKERLVDGFFSPESMVAMFSSAKVVLNIHTWYGKWSHGTNPRLFEAAGCGAFQAVDWKDELPELFDCERELLVYRDQDDLIEKLDAALRDDQLRAEAANRAQARAYAEHTYRNRMEHLLSVIA